MQDMVKMLGDGAVWLAAVGAALSAIWAWVGKPLRKLTGRIEDIREDTGALMGDRLSQAHDYWMRKGYCPAADKARLVDMHQRYSDMGRNHLARNYEQDLLELPEEAPKRASEANRATEMTRSGMNGDGGKRQPSGLFAGGERDPET
ncbi:MAG: hypothetical protein PHI98_15860 [Eubacteriales bacterium]|nr:hypothetical protein [Eubacteriales bacterium]